MFSFNLTRVRACAAACALAISAPISTPAQEPCDCDTQRPEALATVNGVKVLTADVERIAAPVTNELRAVMDQAREQGLQALVENRLIDVEAKRRGMTPAQFIQAEVYAKVADPTEDEIRLFYERGRASLQGTYEENRAKLLGFIRAQRRDIQLTLLRGELRSAATIEILEASPKAPTAETDRARVLAVVNGSKILLGELEDALRPTVFEFRDRVYQVEKQVLDEKIAEILMAQESTRRGMTTQALVETEVVPRARKIDGFEVSKFYQENKDRFGGRPLAEIKDGLTEAMKQEAIAEAARAFADGLRKTADVKVALVAPAPPTIEVAVAGRPEKGDPSAKVTLVEFSDFECPRCAVMHASLEEVLKPYAGRVRLVARHFPLAQHAYSFKAAEAAEAAAEQGKYWEYAALLFANQKDLQPARLKELATQAGLDRAKFDAALDSGKFAATVQRELDDAMRLGVPGTPSFYVNGRRVDGGTPEALRAALDAALPGK